MAEFETGENWDAYTTEPDWARDNLSRNECAVAYFGGQTALYIPKNWFIKLGPGAEQNINDLAIKVYGENDVSRPLSTAKCTGSFLIELPAQTDWSGKQHRPFDKVSELIELIREAVTNK